MIGRTPRGCPAAILAAVLSALALTGCQDPPEPDGRPAAACPVAADAPVAVSMAVRSTSATPELPADVWQGILAATRAGEKISVIRADGAPATVFSSSFASTAQTPEAYEQDYRNHVRTLSAAFGTPLRAVAAEADTLRAITRAADETEPGGTVVVIDSGLQTVPPLRFQDDEGALVSADPAEVVSYLRREGLVPDLNGRRVILAGIGRTAGRQPELDQGHRDGLAAIWSAVARAGKASCVDVRRDPPADEAGSAGLPPVSIVRVPDRPPPGPCGTTVLRDSDVSFVANQAVFREPAEARATIETVAAQMRGHRQTAELVGTTARHGDRAGQVRLAEQRAEAVKAVLVELGVAADRISTRGVGSYWPGYVPDGGPDDLRPGPAARNRTVIVTLRC